MLGLRQLALLRWALFGALFLLSSPSAAIQFDMVAGAKHCFEEEIMPGSPVQVSYTVVDGAGDLPVTLQVKHVGSDSLIYARDKIDNAKFSFRTPGREEDASFAERNHQALPRDAKPDWHVRNEAGEVVEGQPGDGHHRDSRSESHESSSTGGKAQVPPTVSGTKTMPPKRSNLVYSFCFGKTLSDGAGAFHLFPHVPHLPGGRSKGAQSRRIIFELRTGSLAQTRSEVEALAKELHLSESDKLFLDVYGHVSEVIKQIDDMRERAAETDALQERTGALVTAYSVMACASIVLSAGLAAWGSHLTLKRHKVV